MQGLRSPACRSRDVQEAGLVVHAFVGELEERGEAVLQPAGGMSRQDAESFHKLLRGSLVVPQIAITYMNGWNLISKKQGINGFIGTQFPNRQSRAFWFSPQSGYIGTDTLEQGKGYWIRLPDPAASAITPTPVTISVLTGWNLIGLSARVAADSITQAPPGILSSGYYEYGGSTVGYQVDSLLDAGKGYWVKSSSPGTLSFGSSNAARKP